LLVSIVDEGKAYFFEKVLFYFDGVENKLAWIFRLFKVE